MNFPQKKQERIASPDKLDTPPNIVTPWQWGLGVVLIGVTAYLLFWSITGTVTRQIALSGVVTDQNTPTIQIYLSPQMLQQVKNGQWAFIHLPHFGHNRTFRGNITKISPVPQSRRQLEKDLGYTSLADSLMKKDIPYYPAQISFKALDKQIIPGMLLQVSIVVRREKPIFMVFPFLKKFL